jgi:hypothetical protein
MKRLLDDLLGRCCRTAGSAVAAFVFEIDNVGGGCNPCRLGMNWWGMGVALVLAVALGGGCAVKPLDPYSSTGTGGTGAVALPGSTGAGGFPGTGGITGNEVGAVGDWYAFGDGVGPNVGVADAGTDYTDSDCVKKGGFSPESCTQITTPTPGQPFRPTDQATNQYCTYGEAAMVLSKDGVADYADLWGGGIGLNFNPAGDGGAAGYADLSAYSGVEFDFSGNLVPPQSMRVEFPFQGQHGTDAPYWMGSVNNASPLKVGHVEIKWTDVGGPYYLMAEVPPVDFTQYPFDPRAVQAIRFLVFTNTSTAIPYNFCVANLALVPK